MTFKDFYKVLHCEYCPELAEKVFEQGQFSFTEDKIIDQLSMHKNAELEEVISNAKTFGLIVKDNNIILPTGLTFEINNNTPRYSPYAFNIKRNGIEYPISSTQNNIGYNEELNVVLTDFGIKFYKYMIAVDTNEQKAYYQITQMEKIFGINTTK